MSCRAALSIAIVLAGSSLAGAQSVPLSAHDFVVRAYGLNKFDIQMSQVALTSAASDKIKAFARRSIADSGNALKELVTIARAHRIKIKGILADEQRAAFMRMVKMSGTEFDHAFVEQEIKLHDEEVPIYRAYSQGGDHPDLKDYAAARLSTLEKSQEEATKLATGD